MIKNIVYLFPALIIVACAAVYLGYKPTNPIDKALQCSSFSVLQATEAKAANHDRLYAQMAVLASRIGNQQAKSVLAKSAVVLDMTHDAYNLIEGLKKHLIDEFGDEPELHRSFGGSINAYIKEKTGKEGLKDCLNEHSKKIASLDRSIKIGAIVQESAKMDWLSEKTYLKIKDKSFEEREFDDVSLYAALSLLSVFQSDLMQVGTTALSGMSAYLASTDVYLNKVSEYPYGFELKERQ